MAKRPPQDRAYLCGQLTRREVVALIGGGAAIATREMTGLSLATNAAAISTEAGPSSLQLSSQVSVSVPTRTNHMKLASLRLGQIELNRSFMAPPRGDNVSTFRPAGRHQPEYRPRPQYISEAEERIGRIYFGPLRAAVSAHVKTSTKAAVIARYSSVEWIVEQYEKIEKVLNPFKIGKLGDGDRDPVSGMSIDTIRHSEELAEETHLHKRERKRNEDNTRVERLRQQPKGERDQETRPGENHGQTGAGEWEPRTNFRIDVY